ncbi:MAG: hypothetical protein ORN55_01045 [Chitinophagaceae bacterium]|nr:hypothetical protein [Chitinophagaceae bacterium]
MKVLYIFILLIGCQQILHAQKVLDYKTKTSANQAERTLLLELLRKAMYKEFKQEFVFAVDRLNVYNGYAWLKSNASRKDGKEIKLDAEIPYDCCHVEALFVKKNGKWQIYKYGSFSTDVWWISLWDDKKIPKQVFGDDY